MNYQEFIAEVNRHRDDKLKGRLKELEQKYQQEYDDRYMKPFQNKEVKKAQGETLKQGNTYLAQIVPTSKNNQIPFKHSTYGIDTTNREEGLKKKVRTMERLGILHGGTRAKDLN